MTVAGTIKVIVFPGGFNLPLWTGIERQIFKSYGLDVEPQYTVNSVEQLTGMIAGRWEIALTGFDNIVAYQEGQGEAKIDVTPDLFAFMGGDSAFLRLVVQPDIASYADLKGKTLSVDALTTGFAFVLRKMLARNGLSEDDISFERAGGALQRFEALKAGKHAGTLLVTPFELIGKEVRPSRLAECVRSPSALPGHIRRGAAELGKGQCRHIDCIYPRLSRCAGLALCGWQQTGGV